MSREHGAGVSLTVKGADKRDAGRGVARVPEAARNKLGILSGDPVIIQGTEETVAKMWPMGDGEPDVIKIDADTRANAGVNIGDTVTVSTTSVADANIVSVRPTEELPDESDVDSAVKQRLQDRPIREDERVHLEGLGVFVVSLAGPDGAVGVTNNTGPTVLDPPRLGTHIEMGGGGQRTLGAIFHTHGTGRSGERRR